MIQTSVLDYLIFKNTKYVSEKTREKTLNMLTIISEKYEIPINRFIVINYMAVIILENDYENALSYFANDMYSGNIVIFDGKNETEYLAYLMDVRSEFDAYLQKELGKQKIVENKEN